MASKPLFSVEQYALDHNRLHPEIVNYLQPLFGDDIELDTIRITGFARNTSALGTSVWVAGDRIVFRIGTLNAKHRQWEVRRQDGSRAYESNAALDLSTVAGMSVLAHEIRHCWQCRTRPFFGWAWNYMVGLWRSWRAGRFYSHKHVPSEIDAVDFQENVALPWLAERRDGLRVFEELR